MIWGTMVADLGGEGAGCSDGRPGEKVEGG